MNFSVRGGEQVTVNEILVQVRQHLGDMQKLSFSDEELINCLNDGMDELCYEMSQSYDPELLKSITLTTSGVELPEDFISWQGQYPLTYTTTDNKTMLTHLDPDWDGTNSEMKYFAYKPHFTSLTDTIPFRAKRHTRALMQQCVYQIKPKATGGASGDSKGTSSNTSSTGTAQ
jgi:hypothetical protein